MGDREEIFEDQIEVVNSDEDSSKKKEKEPIVRYMHAKNEKNEHPLQDFSKLIEDIRKIKLYGIFSVLFGFFGIFLWIQVLPILAIVMGGLDLLMGSRFTRKVAIVGIVFGVLGLLNAWQ
jgi:hypothetical protein